MNDSPLAILSRISGLLGLAYTRCDTRTVLKIRQSMDIFLDKLLIDIDPNENMRVALKEQILRRDR